ncbi:MAG TPA: DUF3857 domain-containing protein [Vicinamibacterales bacterium]|nr:DUF3857 domain-containing protein [Vicinamibacterales bacterium]
MPSRPATSKLILALSSIILCAWPVWASRQTAGGDYSQEPYVIERDVVKVAFDVDGTQTREIEKRVRVQSAAALKEAGTISVPYSRDLATVDLKFVRVHKPDGAVVETPPASAIDLPAEVTRLAPTYTDLYFKQINVKGLAVGDTLDFALTIRTRSLIPGQFWEEHDWTYEGIVLAEDFEVSVPSSVTPKVKTIGDPQPTVETSAGRRIYRWHHTNLKTLSPKELAVRNFARRDQAADVRVSSFQTWADLGAAVRDLWRDRAQVTPEIRSKALELTRDLKTDDEKVQALYAFVSTKVRYVAVSFGLGRIQPHPAAEVLDNGFGDCKDKSTLLTALLAAVGITAEPALIAPGVPVDADVPSIGQFNHVITSVTRDNRQTWMDTTIEVAPLGLLVEPERDANVLLIPATGAARLIKTPAVPVRASSWHTDTVGTISEAGTLDATVHEVISGDLEVVFRAAFRALPQAQWVEAAKHLSLALRFGGTVSDVVVSPLEDTTTPFRIDYRYTVPEFSDWKDQKITAAVALIYTPQPGDDPPPVPLVLGGPLEYVFSSRLTLPATFNATLNEDAQPDLVIDRDYARYRLQNTLNGHVFETRRELVFKKKEVPPDAFAAYRKFVSDFGDANYSIRLRPSTWVWGAQSSIQWYVGEATDTRKLLQEAVDVAKRGDRQTAETSLKDLARAKPASPNVWMTLGWVQMSAGKREEGIATLRKGIATAPSADAYKNLASSLPAAEAVDVWRDGWQKFGKTDDEFALYYGEALVNAQRYSDAVTVLESQAQKQTKSARFQWDYGRALLNDNKRDAGIAALKSTAELDPRPLWLNNVAWEFAIRSIELDAALALSTRAVKGIEEQASQLTLGKVDAAALGVMVSLGAYWDTLAWTNFKLGRLEEAERYQVAAWDLMREETYASHLAEIAVAKHDEESASLFSELAAVARNSDRNAAARELTAVFEKHAATAMGRATRQASSAPIPKGSAIGTAQAYVLTGSDGKITEVSFIAGDTALRPQIDALRGLKLGMRLPSGTAAKILQRGLLSCADGVPECRLELLPARAAAAMRQ